MADTPATEKVLAGKLLADNGLHGFRVHGYARHGHWSEVAFLMDNGTRQVAFLATFDHGDLYALELGWTVR